MNRAATLLIFLCLSACATPEEIEARKQAQMQEDYNTCVDGYGFKPKSDGARSCMLQLELAREQRYNSYYYGGYWGPRHPGSSVGYYVGY